MSRIVSIEHPPTLNDYAAVGHLTDRVEQLRQEAAPVASLLEGRTVWMINSTAKGGGVAEMLPGVVHLLRELGIQTEWAVIESQQPGFFDLTKHIHNLIHGAGEPRLSAAERTLYESVNRGNAEQLAELMKPGDIVVIHDPQPLPLGPMLKERQDVRIIWRCHIGLDEENRATQAAWSFLEHYLRPYQHAVFSCHEYIPPNLADRASVIYPALDPLASKNREMHLHEVVRILANSALVSTIGPVLRPPFSDLANRLQPGGEFRPAIWPEEIGLLNRPIVTQVSRWDRLKGFEPLLMAFSRLKHISRTDGRRFTPMHRRRLDVVRLVLAGPMASDVADDPEANEVLQELARAWLRLEPYVQSDVALVNLPMHAPRENALMVNALQRASSLVVQNSLREGFGLTVAEAMWKRIPVLTNRRACGPRQQVRDGVDGRLVDDPEDIEALAEVLIDMLSDPDRADHWGRGAQRHVHRNFLIFAQLSSWLQVLAGVA